MKQPHPPSRGALTRVATAIGISLALAGCASTAIDANFADVRDRTRQSVGADVRWLMSDEARRQAQTDVDALLARPLDAEGAVRIALAYSPALQAILYDAAAESAAATQSARLPNPVFTFERLSRGTGDARELDITRVLSFALLDVLFLPTRLRLAEAQQQVTRFTLAGTVVQTAIDARRAWIEAVAAQQTVQYVEQVKAAADAGAELARRMQSAGNFNKLQRAREQAFAADAVARLARARQATRESREALVRILGLNARQADALTLPDRLPDLPATSRDEAVVTQAAMDQRLDVQAARANLSLVARQQGLSRVTSVVNGFELGLVSVSGTGSDTYKGFDINVPLPIFDFGDARRAQSQALYMGALQRTAQLAVDASSQVRERYGAYRTAYDLARHYRDEIVPLRRAIADEQQLRYNGMLIGVFELLADAREQVATVVEAIDAQRDFWLADAALQGTLIGRPTGASSMRTTPTSAASPNGAGH
jgi:outer membrane protein TolC